RHRRRTGDRLRRTTARRESHRQRRRRRPAVPDRLGGAGGRDGAAAARRDRGGGSGGGAPHRPEAMTNLTRFAWLSIAAALVTIAMKTAAFLMTGSVGLLSD